jgi:hypothetical protein
MAALHPDIGVDEEKAAAVREIPPVLFADMSITFGIVQFM